MNGNLVLFVEKDGLFSLVKRLSKKYDTTAIALGGFPSCISSEYFVEELRRQGIGKVRLFGVVDYDPSGYWIAEELQEQLRDNFGLEIAGVHLLIEPKSLPPELIEACKYELDGSPKTRHWLKLTGGIGGEAYGLEADALGGRRIIELYEAAIAPYLRGKKRPNLSL